MKRFSILFLIVVAFVFKGLAQTEKIPTDLVAQFAALSEFDYRYPREAVYLHLDNNAYFEGETIWFKAYVVRASSLCPAPLSRVLYAELLNTDGDIIFRKLLRVDSLGGANGEFKLELPVRGGAFYEVRAYTREMLSWGGEACFSRVVPVFKAEANSDAAPLEIIRPRVEADLRHGHPRPFNFSRSKKPRLCFYPEGGNRVKGLPTRIAYTLTEEGESTALKDTIYIYNGLTHKLLLTSVPLHLGMGSFLLPANIDQAYAKVRGTRFDLPSVNEAADYALSANMNGDLDVVVARREEAKPELLAIAVMCRDEAVYFDTLTVGELPVELQISRKLLGDGVNRIELFNSQGHSLARRLVWGPPTARRISMEVKQSVPNYKPFSPVKLQIALRNVFGKPVQSTFSLAVRDRTSELCATPDEDLATELLLCSELRGYVEDPQWYFSAEEPERRTALDNLLMVQGWMRNRFEVMAGRDSFNLEYPVEDRLLLQGRVLKNSNRERPRSGVTLGLTMFNKAGYHLRSTALTDSAGGFAFASNEDYIGDWIAQFTTRVDGKPVWSRVALNRWFCPPARSFATQEMQISPPLYSPEDTAQVDAEIPDVSEETEIPAKFQGQIGEATITHRGYRGLRGGTYTYLGGETAGMRRATTYYNMEQIVEQIKDSGGDPGLIWDVLREQDEAFDYFPDLDTNDKQYMKLLETIGDSNSNVSTPNVYMFRYAGRPAMVFVDNELFLQRYKGDDPLIFADEVKSIVLMREPVLWRPFLPASVVVSELESLNPTAIFLYTRPDYAYFRSKRGVEKRTIHGFSIPAEFYHPDYHTTDFPTSADKRRTLYWNPYIKSDVNGNVVVQFFAGAYPLNKVVVSARGVTTNGGLIFYEK